MLEKDSTLVNLLIKKDNTYQNMAEAFIRDDTNAIWVCPCFADEKITFATKSTIWNTRKENMS